MSQGWQLFLLNLKLHLQHFAGQNATAMLPGAMWPGPRDETWTAVTSALGVPTRPAVGERIASGSGAPPFAGTVVDAASWRIAVLLDTPAPGTAMIAVEGSGNSIGVSIWSYLYGADAAALAARDRPRWQRWLDDRAVPG